MPRTEDSRQITLDERDGCVAIDLEPIEGHLVESGAALGVVIGELTFGAQQQLRPQPRQVDGAERAGEIGTDQRNDAHRYSLLVEGNSPGDRGHYNALIYYIL